MSSNQAIVPVGLIREVFCSEFTPQLFAGVDTHVPALRLVAQLVRQTEDDNVLQAIVTAALPEDYSGNTLEELPEMIAGARRKGFDKEPARPRGRLSTLDVLIALFAQQDVELFHSDLQTAYVGIPASTGGVINAPVGSARSNHFVQEVYFRATGKGLKERDRDDFNNHLQALAAFEGQRHVVNVRIGGSPSEVYHDLGRDDGAVVMVTVEGYAITYTPAVKLIRMSGMKALPLPKAGGLPHSGLMKFKKLLLLDDQQWPLVLAFLVGVMRPSGPYAFLAIEGEQGSGKSLRCELCKAVIDPGIPMRSGLPKSVQDLMIIANHSHVIIFDNLSGITAEMSDALATLSTKAGFRTRQLYTDAEVHAIEVTRPFMLNGIGEFMRRPDLMDRAIPLRLEAMSEIDRRTEEEIRRDFERLLPELLHDLYMAVAHALRTIEQTPPPTSIRMADAAHWLVAAEEGAGLPAGTILAALENAQGTTQADLAMHDSLFAALEGVLIDEDFEGRPAQLLDLIRVVRGGHLFDRYFSIDSSTTVDEASAHAISAREGGHHRRISRTNSRRTAYPSTNDRCSKRGCEGCESHKQPSLEVLMATVMDQRDGVTAVTATHYLLAHRKRNRWQRQGWRAAGGRCACAVTPSRPSFAPLCGATGSRSWPRVGSCRRLPR